MKVDKHTLNKIAHLARLEIRKEEEESLIKDMSDIISWVEKLNEVDTENVEPLTTMSHEINSFREDKVKGHLDHEKALSNAPKRDADFFRVPKVLK